MNKLPSSDSSMPGCPGTIIKSQTVVAAAAHSSHIPFIKHEVSNEDNSNDDQPDDMQQQKYIAAHSSRGKASCITTTNVSPQDLSSSDSMFEQEVGTGSKEAVDPDEKEKPIRRKRRVKGQKICGVCGDQAQSHNFGALSCETCKAFFRRNALKQKELQTCIFSGSCTITKETRRFCAPCRLKKCYSIGMDPDLILDDDEKRARQIRRSDRSSSNASSEMKLGGGDRLLSVKQEPNVQHQQHPVGEHHVTTSFTSATPPNCCPSGLAFPSSDSSFASRGDSLDSGGVSIVSNSGSSQYNYPNKGKWVRPRNALGRGFRHVARDDLPCDMTLFWLLRTDERALLTELTSSYQTITAAISPEDHEHMRRWTNFCMEKAIFALEISIRQYVQFARQVPEFLQVCQSDQIIMLKCSALQWHNIRLASEFIPERRVWMNSCGSLSQAQLSEFFGDGHGLQEYAEFCEGLKFFVKNDTTLYVLLHILLLFDPRNANLENRSFINSIRDRYLLLTKHHLESQFSYLHADRYLAEVLEQILDLRQLSESSLDFYKYFSSQFRPLIAEVLAAD